MDKIIISRRNITPVALGRVLDRTQLGSKLNLLLLERNADIVKSGGYVEVISGTANSSVTNYGRHYLAKNNLGRIRQPGAINKFKIFIAEIPANLSAMYFQVWRKDGTTYDLVGEQNITSIVEAGINEITIDSITAQEGDFVALATELSSTASTNILLLSERLGVDDSLRYVTNANRPVGNDYAWDSQSGLLDYMGPVINTYAQAPMAVIIGTSIAAGHPGHYSYIENSLTSNIANSVSGQLTILDANYVVQNMGIGSQTTVNLSARFAADVVALKPKFVIIEGGVNDIALSVSKATFLANYTSMLDACATAGIKPVVCKILPWTGGSNANLQTRDDWMVDLKALVATYTGSVWVDFDVDMGQFREGGDEGNLWDLKTAYNQDDVHPNLAGYTKMAEVIDREFKKKYKFE